MANFIEVKVTYRKTLDNGSTKKVNELYLADAINVKEAEDRVLQEFSPYGLDDFEISALRKSAVSEVFFNSRSDADKFYLAKVGEVTVNESTGAEKLSNTAYLVQASGFQSALTSLTEHFKGTTLDYRVLSISESKILDVYIHD